MFFIISFPNIPKNERWKLKANREEISKYKEDSIIFGLVYVYMIVKTVINPSHVVNKASEKER